MQIINNFYAQVNRIGFIAIGDVKAPEFLNATPDSRMQRIIVTDLSDQVIFATETPAKPWNYQTVKAAIAHIDTSEGAFLYFGETFIGCTEM
jgi:hypothetical protein